MPTFIVDNDPEFSRPIVLGAEDEKHVTRVLRARIGETLTVSDNSGHLAVCEIISLSPLNLRLQKIFDGESPLPLTVCLPLIDPIRMEWAVEKLTELNVKTVQLTITDRTQQHKISESKFARLQKTSLAAQKQCGRATPLRLESPLKLSEILKREGFKIAALPQTENTGKTRLPLSTSQDTALFIGPEGGFSDAENKFFIQKKIAPMHLGKTILRAETAAIVATGILKNHDIAM